MPRAPTSRTLPDALKQEVVSAIDLLQNQLIDVAKTIHSFAELPFEESCSSQLLVNILRDAGFLVQYSVAGLTTAFRGEFRGGDIAPTIAIGSEYDAVEVVDYGGRQVRGHACGHNLNAGAAIGAALALSQVMPKLNGRLLVMGTPAEEGGAGKVLMLECGVWDDVDIAMFMHGDQRGWNTLARTCACTKPILA